MFKKIKNVLKQKPSGGEKESGDSSPLKSGKTASEKVAAQKAPAEAEKAVPKKAESSPSKAVESEAPSSSPLLKDKGPGASSSVKKKQVSARPAKRAPDSPQDSSSQGKQETPSDTDSAKAPAEAPAGSPQPVTSPPQSASKSEDGTGAPSERKPSPPPDESQPAPDQGKPVPPQAMPGEKPALVASGLKPEIKPSRATADKPPAGRTKPRTAESSPELKSAPRSESQRKSEPDLKSAPPSESEETAQPEAAGKERPEKETLPPRSPQRETLKLQGLFAFKQSMTSFYDEKGRRVPVTALKYEPWLVSQIKTKEKEGYSAVQLAGLPQKNGRCNRPLTKHLVPAGFREGARFLREIRQELPEGIKVGQELSIESLKKGDRVQISGRSKGRGFSGSVKRWGFRGGPASHGSKTHRKTGSIGQCAEPARVMPGRKMPGRYGFKKITLNSVLVVDVLPQEGMIFVKGPVSGARNTLVSLTKTGRDHA